MQCSAVVPNARQRVKDAVTAEIVTVARDHLATEGADALSLRAIARQMGMASSAIYRYFPSRDELLTALITEAFDALGQVAETAAAAEGRAFERWQSVCRAVRAWALRHPHEYALIYGSPVPGYEAPEQTVGPASRVALVLAGLLVDAQRAGELTEIDAPALSRAMAAEARQLSRLAMPGVPLSVVARSIVAWTQLFGHLSFELFGQLAGVVKDTELMFEFEIATTAGLLGLEPRGARRHSQAVVRGARH
ncbi:MAG: TetR/AcrR family transcriptional regulator [Acidimicrobiales bacterium]|jgi:AcrR family transcriptional regulator